MTEARQVSRAKLQRIGARSANIRAMRSPARQLLDALAWAVLGTSLTSCRSTSTAEPTPGAAGAVPSASAATGVAAAEPSVSAVLVASAEPPRAPHHDQAPLGSIALPELAAPPELRAGAPSIAELFDGYGFPPVPRLAHLCGKRLFGSDGRNFTTDAFASDDTPADVVAAFRARLGQRGFEARDEGGTWSVPAQHPTRTLRVDALTVAGPHESCARKPGASARAIVTLMRE